MKITGTGWNQVRDIYLYGDTNFASDWGLDAENGGGVKIGICDSGDNGVPLDTDYAVATGEIGVGGHSIMDAVNGHPYYLANGDEADLDDYDANSPLLIDSGPYTTEFESKGWVMCLHIVPTATYGAKTPKALTVIYNIF